jgi:hypothetical protein
MKNKLVCIIETILSICFNKKHIELSGCVEKILICKMEKKLLILYLICFKIMKSYHKRFSGYKYAYLGWLAILEEFIKIP